MDPVLWVHLPAKPFATPSQYLQHCRGHLCMVQSCKTGQLSDLHIPSWGRPRGLDPLVQTLIRRWPEARASGGSTECKKLGFWGAWNRVWISTLAALSGAASGKSLITSQPHVFFCKIKKIWDELILGWWSIWDVYAFLLGAANLYSVIQC